MKKPFTPITCKNLGATECLGCKTLLTKKYTDKDGLNHPYCESCKLYWYEIEVE